MAKFKLTPVVGQINNPLWERSQVPHEACYVGASDEQNARAFASYHFREPLPAEHGKKFTFESPWLHPEVTACIEIVEIAGDHMPNGLVERESEVHRMP